MTDSESRAPTQLVLPQLRYAHPIDAIAWLCHVFGFIEQSRMSGSNGELYIAVVAAPGGGTLMIAGPAGEEERARLRDSLPQFRDTEPGWPNLSYSITVIVPDVNAHYEQARAEGAHILVRPQDQPWGLRDYEVLDLEGRLWNFSQRLRSVEPEDWGAVRVE